MAHPLFPRVVVYLYRTPNPRRPYAVMVLAQSDYGAKWRAAGAVRSYVSVGAARAAAHELGGKWVARLHAPKDYELVHGAPASAQGDRRRSRVKRNSRGQFTRG